jgi:hypothetical protein
VNLDELHDELVRMGRRPVPAPRPEFVRSLLDRIQLDEDLPAPLPIELAPRRREPWARFRMVAIGAVAAALLSVVGLVSVFRDGSGGKELTISASPVVNSQVSVPPAKEITVGSDGSVATEDGHYRAACPAEGTKIPTAQGVYVCRVGETVLLEIGGQRILFAGPEDGSAGPDATPTTGAPGAEAGPGGPGPSVAPPAPVTVVPTPGASASVVTTTTAPGAPPTTTTSSSTPPPSGGGGVLPPLVAPSFALNFSTPAEGTVKLTWDKYAEPNFARYVILRTSSLTGRPDTPTYTPDDTDDVVAERTPVDNTTYAERFVDVLRPGTSEVSYRVAVLDAKGELLAMSSTTTLELEWTLKPSEEPTPSTTTAPPPTVANPPSTTTSTTAGS